MLVRDGAEVITSPDQATPGRKVELQFAGGRRRRAVIDGGAAIRKPAKSAPSSGNQGSLYNLIPRSLRAFVITHTEDRLMVAAANIGESIMPKNG